MGFKRFTDIKNHNKPKASIRTNGVIGFNKAARNKFIKDYKYCEFYYDNNNKQVGLNLTNLDDGHVANIRITDKDCMIPAITFLHKYLIPYNKKRSCNPLLNMMKIMI